jgi:hypothetical protein
MLGTGHRDCQADLKSLWSKVLLVGFVGVMMLYCPHDEE